MKHRTSEVIRRRPGTEMIGVFHGHVIRTITQFKGEVVVATDKGTYMRKRNDIAGVTVWTWDRVYVA